MKKIEKITLIGRISPQWLAKLLDYTFLPLLGTKKVNRIFEKLKDTKSLHFIEGVMKEVGITVYAEGIEQIPLRGGVTIAGNHPGGMDIIGYASELVRHRADTKILVNKNLNLTYIAENIIGVSKNKRLLFDNIDKSYRNENCVVFNPTGKNSRFTDGILEDSQWKGSFIAYALKYKTPLVLFHVTGRNHWWWYHLAYIREKIGIKNRIETFFMMWNFAYPPDKCIQIRFSSPINCKELETYVNLYGLAKTSELFRRYVHENKCKDSFRSFLLSVNLHK